MRKDLLRLYTQLVTPKSLACDTANEHALTCTIERHAAAVRQLSNGTNGNDLYSIHTFINGREHYSDSKPPI